MTLPPLIIAALYKRRWQVELFFKWIKQHLRIKRFLGTSENAVKTQIWSAVSTYTLIAIIKKESQLDASLYTLLQILSVAVFEKTPLLQAFSTALNKSEPDDGANQLNLFDFYRTLVIKIKAKLKPAVAKAAGAQALPRAPAPKTYAK